MKTINVEVTFTIPVKVPDDDPKYDVYFDIEENHCPGTGRVGTAIDKHIKDHEKCKSCWACALGAKNKIVD